MTLLKPLNRLTHGAEDNENSLKKVNLIVKSNESEYNRRIFQKPVLGHPAGLFVVLLKCGNDFLLWNACAYLFFF
jgi:hypothetical protein